MDKEQINYFTSFSEELETIVNEIKTELKKYESVKENHSECLENLLFFVNYWLIGRLLNEKNKINYLLKKWKKNKKEIIWN